MTLGPMKEHANESETRTAIRAGEHRALPRGARAQDCAAGGGICRGPGAPATICAAAAPSAAPARIGNASPNGVDRCRRVRRRKKRSGWTTSGGICSRTRPGRRPASRRRKLREPRSPASRGRAYAAVGAAPMSPKSVSRTRCGILHAAPQSRDRTEHNSLVMRGLGPRIHVLLSLAVKTWMAGTSPAMTRVAFVTAPALQRTAAQELRAALRPGHAASYFEAFETGPAFAGTTGSVFTPAQSCYKNPVSRL